MATQAPKDLINELQRAVIMCEVHKAHIKDMDKEYTKLRIAFIELLENCKVERMRVYANKKDVLTYEYEWLDKAGILD